MNLSKIRNFFTCEVEQNLNSFTIFNLHCENFSRVPTGTTEDGR